MGMEGIRGTKGREEAVGETQLEGAEEDEEEEEEEEEE